MLPMGTRLLPRSLPELFSHALMIEREATKRFAELEKAMRDAGLDHLAEEFEVIGREEREQFEALTVGTAGHDLPEVPRASSSYCSRSSLPMLSNSSATWSMPAWRM